MNHETMILMAMFQVLKGWAERATGETISVPCLDKISQGIDVAWTKPEPKSENDDAAEVAQK